MSRNAHWVNADSGSPTSNSYWPKGCESNSAVEYLGLVFYRGHNMSCTRMRCCPKVQIANVDEAMASDNMMQNITDYHTMQPVKKSSTSSQLNVGRKTQNAHPAEHGTRVTLSAAQHLSK